MIEHKHKTISLADQVFEQLEYDILSGKYTRGDLLTESKLGAALGVSRTPIREALRHLAQEHLIEETAKGSIVIGITEDDLRDIFLLRENIEGLAARRAAENDNPEGLAQLKEIVELQAFYLTKRDADKIKEMDNRFHDCIYRLSGSMTFFDCLKPLHKKVQQYRRAAVENTSRATASVEEHQAIYEAIAAHDGDLAAQRMTEHIQNAYRHIARKD
ncbi:MAG: GntR family transcriptional regulator [Clostridia bacterium]|nr:GntR family transcriptional regulator [Clostridia bacterium]